MLRAAFGSGNVLKEQLGYLTPAAGQKRMDIVIDVASGPAMASIFAGNPILIDVNVPTPVCPSYVADAAKDNNTVTANAEKKKERKYLPYLPDGHQFHGWIIDSFGAWGRDATNLFQEVVNMVQQHGEAEGDKHAGDHFMAYWLPTIQATLMRSNAQAVLHRSRRDRVAAGKRAGVSALVFCEDGQF